MPSAPVVLSVLENAFGRAAGKREDVRVADASAYSWRAELALLAASFAPHRSLDVDRASRVAKASPAAWPDTGEAQELTAVFRAVAAGGVPIGEFFIFFMRLVPAWDQQSEGMCRNQVLSSAEPGCLILPKLGAHSCRKRVLSPRYPLSGPNALGIASR